MSKLTKRQDQIYTYLLEHFQDFAEPPTLDELCQALGLSSRGSMHKHIHALIDAGLVEPMLGKQRGIRLCLPPDESTLPYLGKIAAGTPLEAIEDPTRIEVPHYLRSPGQCYVLEVNGDSMQDDGILDGDYVVIEKCKTAKNGDIVVAIIDNYEATLKRLESTESIVLLHAANKSIKPFVFESKRVKIQGKLVGQMRRYTS